MKSNVLILIVNKGEASKLMKRAREVGAPGGTIMSARGTATNAILASLGLGDSHKEVLISVISEDLIEPVFDSFKGSKGKGIALLLSCNRVVKAESELIAEGEREMETNWEVIQIICNDGYSEDIMAAARKAGAIGGTVLEARGTGTDKDVQFFGTPLVPEKELIMIVVEKEKVDAIVSAVSNLDCLQQKGMGIIYSMPVKRFQNLG